jgi:hypothetical protein
MCIYIHVYINTHTYLLHVGVRHIPELDTLDSHELAGVEVQRLQHHDVVRRG